MASGIREFTVRTYAPVKLSNTRPKRNALGTIEKTIRN